MSEEVCCCVRGRERERAGVMVLNDNTGSTELLLVQSRLCGPHFSSHCLCLGEKNGIYHKHMTAQHSRAVFSLFNALNVLQYKTVFCHV